MSAKHTPGPWLIEGGGKSHKSINSTNGACVADVWRINVRKQEAIANTRLIAAAPELLDALIHLLHNSAPPYSEDSGMDADFNSRYDYHSKKALAVIAKATGEQP